MQVLGKRRAEIAWGPTELHIRQGKGTERRRGGFLSHKMRKAPDNWGRFCIWDAGKEKKKPLNMHTICKTNVLTSLDTARGTRFLNFSTMKGRGNEKMWKPITTNLRCKQCHCSWLYLQGCLIYFILVIAEVFANISVTLKFKQPFVPQGVKK